MKLFDELVEAAAFELHQHGPLPGGDSPTADWRECPRRESHEGAAHRVVTGVIDRLWDSRIEWIYQTNAHLDEVERLIDGLREVSA